MRRMWDGAERRLAPSGFDEVPFLELDDDRSDAGRMGRPHPTDRRIKSLALWTTVPILDGLTTAERRELRSLLEKSS